MHAHLVTAALAALLWTTQAQAQFASRAAPDYQRVPFINAEDPDFKDPTNAALVYNRAIMLMVHEQSVAIGEAYSSADPNWAPSPALIDVLRNAQDVIDMFIRGSRIDRCDFGVEYSQGIAAMLPHLGKMRMGSRFLAADARRLAREGKPDDAAERVAAMFHMARHSSGDHLLISSLVGVAMHQMACQQVEFLINSGQMTAAGKKLLVAAIERFDTPDPWKVKDSIRGERYWVVVWLRAQLARPDGLKFFREQITPMFENPDSEDAKAILAMDAATLNAELDKGEGYYTAATAIFDQPDAQQQLKALGERVSSGEYGILCKHMLPAMSKAHESHLKALARQQDIKAKLTNFIAPGN